MLTKTVKNLKKTAPPPLHLSLHLLGICAFTECLFGDNGIVSYLV